MMDPDDEHLFKLLSNQGDPLNLLQVGEQLQADRKLYLAATAIDRACGLDPNNSAISEKRQSLLDQLALREHGIVFRYIPAGTFMMGSSQGDPDEQPVHAVELDHFWLSETPISWADCCRLMGWELPPVGMPGGIKLDIKKMRKEDEWLWHVSACNRIRLQYCENETLHARGWHAHVPGQIFKKGTADVSAQELFGQPERGDPTKPWGYDAKPMIALTWELAQKLCARLSSAARPEERPSLFSTLFSRTESKQPLDQSSAGRIEYRLPTEAEWEKAARGGLLACRYPWGNDPPTPDCCDFGRFEEFSVLPMKSFAPNAYGLYAMSGCVWEWVADWYDSEFYAVSPMRNPRGPSTGKHRVVRGGSWADCAEPLTVSFRMCMGGEDFLSVANPNVGFRLCRGERVLSAR